MRVAADAPDLRGVQVGEREQPVAVGDKPDGRRDAGAIPLEARNTQKRPGKSAPIRRRAAERVAQSSGSPWHSPFAAKCASRRSRTHPAFARRRVRTTTQAHQPKRELLRIPRIARSLPLRTTSDAPSTPAPPSGATRTRHCEGAQRSLTALAIAASRSWLYQTGVKPCTVAPCARIEAIESWRRDALAACSQRTGCTSAHRNLNLRGGGGGGSARSLGTRRATDGTGSAGARTGDDPGKVLTAAGVTKAPFRGRRSAVPTETAPM